MRQFIKKTSHMIALPPGTLVHVGTKKTEKEKITVIDDTYLSSLSNRVNGVMKVLTIIETIFIYHSRLLHGFTG